MGPSHWSHGSIFSGGPHPNRVGWQGNQVRCWDNALHWRIQVAGWGGAAARRHSRVQPLVYVPRGCHHPATPPPPGGDTFTKANTNAWINAGSVLLQQHSTEPALVHLFLLGWVCHQMSVPPPLSLIFHTCPIAPYLAAISNHPECHWTFYSESWHHYQQ